MSESPESGYVTTAYSAYYNISTKGTNPATAQNVVQNDVTLAKGYTQRGYYGGERIYRDMGLYENGCPSSTHLIQSVSQSRCHSATVPQCHSATARSQSASQPVSQSASE